MNIIIATPASIATPPPGYRTLFFNALDNNILYYKDDQGNIAPYTGNISEEDCCCGIAKELMDKIGCALSQGVITATDFMNIINGGISINGSSTDDGNGNKTCEMNISGLNIPVTGVSVAPASVNPLAVAAQAVAVATVAPANASNRNVIWSSSNVTVATVNSNGIITGVAPGNATITATTADGLFTDTCAVTVV